MKTRTAVAADVAAISAIASRTFALACPANTPPAELQAYIDDKLTPSAFAAVVADPRYVVRVLEEDAEVVGFSLLDRAPAPLDLAAADGIPELTRCYVLPAFHGSGAAQALVDATLEGVTTPVRLMVNDQNVRAIRFYARNGFAPVGERTFQCGDDVHRDLVMVRPAAVLAGAT